MGQEKQYRAFLDTYEVAEILGLSIKTIIGWRYVYNSTGRMQGPEWFKDQYNGRIRYRLEDIQKYMEKMSNVR